MTFEMNPSCWGKKKEEYSLLCPVRSPMGTPDNKGGFLKPTDADSSATSSTLQMEGNLQFPTGGHPKLVQH